MLPVLLWSVNGVAQHTVSGTVTDAIGDDPLPGVNIVVKGTTTGTVTLPDGTYELNVPSDADTLVFSFIGFEPQEIAIDGRDEIDVSLEMDVIAGEEMVVVGFGEQTRESVVGAISTVSGERIERARGPSNLTAALQGSAPGVTVYTTNERPGSSGATIQIRASTTLGSTSPLFIVDGVERPNINDIDAAEIESVSILKEASATAVYGVKAANGVVIVQTRRGREGQLRLNFSSETTLKTPTRLPPTLNAYETLQLRNEAYRNDQMWDAIIPDDVLAHYRDGTMPYVYNDFDWMEYFWGDAIDQRYNLSASGGGELVRYFASFSYLNEQDVYNLQDAKKVFPYELNPEFRASRYNFRNNLDFDLTESTMFSMQLSGSINEWNRPNDSYTQEKAFLPVTALPYYPQEALELYPDDVIPFSQTGVRPYRNASQGNVRMMWVGGMGTRDQKDNRFAANLVLNQKLDVLLPGLEMDARYSYQTFNAYQRNNNLGQFYGYFLFPDGSWERYTRDGGINRNTPQPNINIGNRYLSGASRSHDYRVQLNYRENFEDHNLMATTVFARRISQGTSSFPSYEESWIARSTYNYQSRYFLEGSIAHTGSEKFRRGLRFGTFPSFGVAWMASNENFFRDTPSLNFINHMKVRYSWGAIGSDSGIQRWLYRTTYDQSGGISFGFPYQGNDLIQEADVPVPNATWETAYKQNIGLELGFFDSQITLDIDAYNERREDILMGRQSIPMWMGTTGSVQDNLGIAVAHGIEFSLGLNRTFGNGLNLFFDGHMSGFESRVDFWDEPATKPINQQATGKPVDVARRMNYFTPLGGVDVVGYYQNIDEIFMYPQASGNPGLGDHKYLDYNGDGRVDDQDRLVAESPFVPDWNWNVDLGFNYRNWSGSVTFYGISEVNFTTRQGGMFHLYPFTQNKDNAQIIHADSWRPGNPDAKFPSVHYQATDHYNYRQSSFAVLNGQYWRLRRAFISYRWQTEFLNNVGINQVEFTLTGLNLWTWTAMDEGFGGDPEGANYGQDFGAYPISRRFTFGTRITF
ncbi:MAG: SusC/RagA family TonB-linked outer membrane protein [Balneolaceae bacterium]